MFARRVVAVWLSAVTASQIKPSDTVPGYLAKYGIPVESHWITTDDGYILGTFRLARPSAPVALLQHGLLGDAWSFLDNDPALSPGIQLYEQGYDVWLTNDRGNTYSTNHTTLRPSLSKDFWDFSFADMGRMDVPANIRYILGHTGQEQLTYVGWSSGTTQFFVAMADDDIRPYLEQSVNLFVALSPVVFFANQKSPLITVLADLDIGALVEAAFPFGFLNADGLDSAANLLCKLTAGAICDAAVDIICGLSSLDSKKAITNLTAHYPAGTSVKNMNHFEQLFKNKGFYDYDYGKRRNMEKYGQAFPPAFDVSKLSVPTALFVGGSDDFGDHTDVATLTLQLAGNPALIYNQEYPDFSHMTWLVGNEQAFNQYFPAVLHWMQAYNPLPPTAVV